jgi:hypothetical protein
MNCRDDGCDQSDRDREHEPQCRGASQRDRKHSDCDDGDCDAPARQRVERLAGMTDFGRSHRQAQPAQRVEHFMLGGADYWTVVLAIFERLLSTPLVV